MKELIEIEVHSSTIEPDDESYESLDELRRDLLEDEEFRNAYAESSMNTFVAAQIKTLREQRGMTQDQLAAAIGTKQAGVSRFENVNYTSWKTDTLRRLARALQVRLKISFEEFGSLLDEVDRFSKGSLQRVLPAEDARLKFAKPRRIAGSVFYRPVAAPVQTIMQAGSVVGIDSHKTFQLDTDVTKTLSVHIRGVAR